MSNKEDKGSVKEEPKKSLGYECEVREAIEIAKAIDDITYNTFELDDLLKLEELAKELDGIKDSYLLFEKKMVKNIKPNEPIKKYKKEFKLIDDYQSRKIIITKAFNLTPQVLLQNVKGMKRRLVSLAMKVLCYKENETNKSS